MNNSSKPSVESEVEKLTRRTGSFLPFPWFSQRDTARTRNRKHLLSEAAISGHSDYLYPDIAAGRKLLEIGEDVRQSITMTERSYFSGIIPKASVG